MLTVLHSLSPYIHWMNMKRFITFDTAARAFIGQLAPSTERNMSTPEFEQTQTTTGVAPEHIAN